MRSPKHRSYSTETNPKEKTIIPVTRKCAADDDLANSMLNLDPLQHPRSTLYPLKDNLYSLLYWLF